jgi:hypothetical protein
MRMKRGWVGVVFVEGPGGEGGISCTPTHTGTGRGWKNTQRNALLLCPPLPPFSTSVSATRIWPESTRWHSRRRPPTHTNARVFLHVLNNKGEGKEKQTKLEPVVDAEGGKGRGGGGAAPLPVADVCTIRLFACFSRPLEPGVSTFQRGRAYQRCRRRGERQQGCQT